MDATPVSVSHEGRILRGELFLPTETKGAVPLVLVVHEWWGLTDHPRSRAKRLAEELGVAALAVDLFGGKTAQVPAEAQGLAGPFHKNPGLGIELLRSFAGEGLAAARARGRQVNRERTYAIGFCFGGTQVLNLARTGDSLPGGGRLAGVASFHGGLGSALHFQKGCATEVLVLNGAADPMVTPGDIDAIGADAKKAGVRLRFIDYPGALHAFTNPKATELGKKFGMPIAYDEAADRASWQELVRMIRDGLPRD